MANPSSRQAITALLTEHLRYTPLTLLDDIINTVNDLVYRAVTAIEQGLNSASGAQLGFADAAAAENRTPEKDALGNDIFPEAKLEIENGVHQLETLLEATVDKNFDKLEIYVLRNILSVPDDIAPWVRLSHYENLDLNPTITNTPTPETLFQLRRKTQETLKLQAALAAESARNAALIKQLRTILYADPDAVPTANESPTQTPGQPSYAFLTSTLGAKVLGVEYPPALGLEAPDPQPFTSHTNFALSHLPALREILAQLRPALQTLPAAPRPGTATQEERRDYLESRTRRVLEREGMDLETGEGLIGGSAIGGDGRRVGAEEVRDVESVMEGMLGRNN